MTNPIPCGVCGCKRIVYTTLTSSPVQWTADCPHCGFTSSRQATKGAAIIAWNSEQPAFDANGWCRCADTLPPFGLQVRLWKMYENGGGEESHGNRQRVTIGLHWIREWIWSTPDGTTDENPKDVPYRYTHWQPITPPTDSE